MDRIAIDALGQLTDLKQGNWEAQSITERKLQNENEVSEDIKKLRVPSPQP